MNREIKFRGLTDTQSPTWVYGCLVNNLWNYSEHSKYKKGSPVCEIITGKYEGDCWQDIAEQEEDAIVTVVPNSVGQFTGRKDDNGVEIYEGDIIINIKGELLSIEWNDDTCKFQFSNGYDINDGETYSCYKVVVGNIYENANLINS